MDNKKITIDDIARDLGISKTTVSRAISGKGRIGTATREKVLSYISEKNYRPSAIAKGLAQSKTYNLAFAMPSDSKFIDLPFFQRCMWGICAEGSKADYDVLLCIVDENDISGLKRLADNHKVDGVILGRTYENGLAEKYLFSEGIPFVTIGTSAAADAVQIDNDHVEACRELTGRLLDEGLRRLAVIGGRTEHIVNKSRLTGFTKAHTERGLKTDNAIMYMGSSDKDSVEKALAKVLEQNVDCIVCTDDSVCNTVINRLLSLKLEIPKDMRVASFYNSTTLENFRPTITSLEFDAVGAGMLSCSTLLNLIDGVNVSKKTLLGYNILMRDSTRK